MQHNIFLVTAERYDPWWDNSLRKIYWISDVDCHWAWQGSFSPCLPNHTNNNHKWYISQNRIFKFSRPYILLYNLILRMDFLQIKKWSVQYSWTIIQNYGPICIFIWSNLFIIGFYGAYILWDFSIATFLSWPIQFTFDDLCQSRQTIGVWSV